MLPVTLSHSFTHRARRALVEEQCTRGAKQKGLDRNEGSIKRGVAPKPVVSCRHSRAVSLGVLRRKLLHECRAAHKGRTGGGGGGGQEEGMQASVQPMMAAPCTCHFSPMPWHHAQRSMLPWEPCTHRHALPCITPCPAMPIKPPMPPLTAAARRPAAWSCRWRRACRPRCGGPSAGSAAGQAGEGGRHSSATA